MSGADMGPIMTTIAAYFIQKDHESYEWIRDTFGDQVKRCVDAVSECNLLFKEKYRVAMRRIEELESKISKLEDKIG